MKKAFALIPLLMFVVSVSGCIGGGDGFAGLMGTGAQEEKAPNDILKIDNLKVVPSAPVRAGSDFSLSFQINNLNDRESAQNVDYRLYDWGRCDIKDDASGASPTSNEFGQLFPGSTKLVEWKFEAPTNEELGMVSGDCPLRFEVSYGSSAVTSSDAIVVSQDRMDQISRSGESLSVSPSEYQSRGPVKTDIEFPSSQPFLEGSSLPFTVTIGNKGSGEVANLLNKDICIQFKGEGGNVIKESEHCPENVNVGATGQAINEGDLSPDVSEGDGSDSSGDTSGSSSGMCSYPREGGDSEIPFIDKETPPIKCEVETPEIDSPLKTYSVEVSVPSYTYTLYKEKSVEVKLSY